jgi:hypothetical protein
MNVRKAWMCSMLLLIGTIGVLVYLLPSSADTTRPIAQLPATAAMISNKESVSMAAVDPATSMSVVRTGGISFNPVSLASTALNAWKRSITSVQLEAEALNLLAGGQPVDGLQAMSLHSLCISGFDSSDFSPNQVEKIDATFGSTARRVAQVFDVRCGELGKLSFLSRISDVQARAAQAQVPLALAPGITNTTIDQGLSEDQFKRLSEIMVDNEAATLWLTRNFRRLDGLLQNADGFNGVPREDLRAATIVAFCVRGVDCGENSLLSLQLCVNTSGKICSEGGVLAAIQNLSPDAAQRINASAQRIDAALSEGNPTAIGFRRRD